MYWNWLWKMTKTKDDRQFEILDGRLIDIQGKLKKLREAIIDGDTGDNSEVLTAINNLTGKVDTMSSNIDRIEKEAADMAENVGLIRTAIEDFKSAQADMKALVAQLQEQIAQGQLDQARLDAAAVSLEKSDDDIDAIVLPGDTGGGGA